MGDITAKRATAAPSVTSNGRSIATPPTRLIPWTLPTCFGKGISRSALCTTHTFSAFFLARPGAISSVQLALTPASCRIHGDGKYSSAANCSSPPRDEGWLKHKENFGEGHLGAADGVVAHTNLTGERPIRPGPLKAFSRGTLFRR